MKRFLWLLMCFIVGFSCTAFIPRSVEGCSENETVVSTQKYSVVTEDEFSSVCMEDEITLDYVLTLLARVHYLNENPDKTIQDVPVDTVKYCQENGIFNDWLENYKVPLTCGVFADLLVNTIKDMDLPKVNEVAEGSIPGVEEDYYWKEPIYLCYEYGLFNGMDEQGTFIHEETLKVNQTFNVLNRVLNSEDRVLRNFE